MKKVQDIVLEAFREEGFYVGWDEVFLAQGLDEFFSGVVKTRKELFERLSRIMLACSEKV